MYVVNTFSYALATLLTYFVRAAETLPDQRTEHGQGGSQEGSL